MTEPNVCVRCGGRLESQIITHRQNWGAELYEFEDVPALVCSQCGEVWLSAETGDRIERIIKSHPEPTRFHQVPVFSLTDLATV